MYICGAMTAALAIKQNVPDPVRILLIEGDQGCAQSVTDALERIEWAYARIDTAASLAQALARLKAEKFDLVITALELPDSEGLATLKELAGAFEHLIVVLAADNTPRDRVISHGAFDVLPKAMTQAALERLLRLATAQAGSVRSLRDSEPRFREAYELARCQEVLARFADAALAVREPKALIDEAVRMAGPAIQAREVSFIISGSGTEVAEVLRCGVHFVRSGTAVVPVRHGDEVRGALSVQGERVGAESLPFLNTLASLLATALQRMESEGSRAVPAPSTSATDFTAAI
jgi:DNA-binding response OmpR family regulator